MPIKINLNRFYLQDLPEKVSSNISNSFLFLSKFQLIFLILFIILTFLSNYFNYNKIITIIFGVISGMIIYSYFKKINS